MSISSEITRIQAARNSLRNKAVELGLCDNTVKIDGVASAFETVENRGAVSAQVQEGDTYTIPKGYHNGSGTVSGVSGGGNYSLQSKTVSPSKNQQNITPDSGYYGLSDVTVGAIPAAYQDVSSVTAEAAHVLANKLIVTSDGSLLAGTMANNGAVSRVLDCEANTYTIPEGYHNGKGSVSLVKETKTVTPSKSAQTLSATSGKVLSSVTVEAIPEQCVETADASASASQILSGATAYVDGVKLEGTMADNGDCSQEMDGLSVSSVTVPAGYTSGGVISLGDDIETALAAL